MVRTETVFVTRVVCRDVVIDFFAGLRNIIGGRIKGYEKMINEGIKETTDTFQTLYPTATNKNIRMQEIGKQSIIIIVYGEQIARPN